MSDKEYDWSHDWAIRDGYLRGLPVGGLRGKAARLAFGVVAIPAVVVAGIVGSGNAGLFAYTVPFLVSAGETIGSVATCALVFPCAVVTYRQATGPRFPLLAIVWLALTCAATASAAWLLVNVPRLNGWGSGLDCTLYFAFVVFVAILADACFLEWTANRIDHVVGIDWKSVARDDEMAER